jgi:flavin-dependent dehydrogenase
VLNEKAPQNRRTIPMETSLQNPSVPDECDVLVIGGALSGAATALLLKRKHPEMRVVLVEKSDALSRRVGEATVEISGYFLRKVLGLTRFLTHTQLCKNGLRFWFSNAETGSVSDCAEIGGKYLSTIPSFLVDRSQMDEEVLRLAREAGTLVLRPAQVRDVELQPGGFQKLTVQPGGGAASRIRARWVIDASGVRCLLARSQGWWKSNTEHPTLSCWSRWKSVRHWDHGPLQDAAEDNDAFVGLRSTATNHLVGHGWWAWWISLRDGDTSIGVVLDQRLQDWPESREAVGEKLRAFLSQHPAARDMMEGAEFQSGDVHFRRNLAYCSEVQCGDGFVLVGDASAFLDPLYSPGMDWTSFTTCSAVKILSAWWEKADLESELQRHQSEFVISYRRSFEALYKDKYEYLGDFELLKPAFLMDIALYYLFVVLPVFKLGQEQLVHPPYSHPRAGPVFNLMRLYNRRLAAIARVRKAHGDYGRRNARTRFLFGGFNLRISILLRAFFKGLWLWGMLEFQELFRARETAPEPAGPVAASVENSAV